MQSSEGSGPGPSIAWSSWEFQVWETLAALYGRQLSKPEKAATKELIMKAVQVQMCMDSLARPGMARIDTAGRHG